MKCPKCQFENLEEAKFCIECGQSMEFHCPHCGEITPARGKFCMECGHDLSLPSEPAPKDLSFEEKLDKIQRYLPKGLTDKILSQRDKIEGERKQVTVMFCDMEGFTHLSERLGPEEAYGIMDQIYEILIHSVHDYEGTVNEMTGDGIVALFGAPIALEDAPQRAVRSALAIHGSMAEFNTKLRQERKDLPPLRMRIGVHTGPVVVGTLGNDLRVEFKAVGDTVNLASRMEGLAEPGTCYVTEETFKLTEGLFRFEALGERKIKGKEESVQVYRVIAASTRRTRFEVGAERGLTPFVGRERELELLLDGLERAKAGRGQAFSIVADAGVGKSRLLYEFRKAVSSEDATFLEGRCLSYGGDVGYHPIIDTLKANYDIREGDRDSEIRRKVKEGLKVLGADEALTLPYLLELLSVKDSGIDKIPMSPEMKKVRIIEALKQIVIKGSENRPLVLAIEDLYWVDKSSEEVLKSLLESIPGARILLIFTYRPTYVHTWGAKSYHSQLNLNRLANRESLAMVTHLLGTEDIPSDLAELILEKTEGIPFFIEEFIKSLIDLKIVEKRDGKYHLAKSTQEVTIPSTIQDVIMARIDSLPEGAKEVLQIGSAIEREFSYELIKQVVSLSEQELLSCLSALRDSELLYERGIYPQSTYIFKHALTRDVAYDSLLLKRKQEIHENMGNAIEELYAEGLEQFYEILAYHYARTENLEKTYQYLKLSGEKANRNFANWEAYRYCKEAIEILKKLPEEEEYKREQLEARLLMVSFLHLLGYPEDSLQVLEEGERLSRELEDERSLASFLGEIGSCYSVRGDPRGIEHTKRGFEVAQKIQDIEIMAVTGADLCRAYFIVGEFRKAVEMSSPIIKSLKQSQKELEFFGAPNNPYCILCNYSGGCDWLLGNIQQGEVLFNEAIRVATETNYLPTLAIVETTYVYAFFLKGDGEGTIEMSQRSIKHHEETKTSVSFGFSWCFLGSGYLLLGELETAREFAEKGLEIHLEQGLPFMVSAYYYFLGMIYFGLGDSKNAQAYAEKAVRSSQQNNEKWLESCSWTWLGRILGGGNPPQMDKAEKSILAGIKIANEMGYKVYCSEGHFFLGELYANTGQREKALENLTKAEGMYQEMGLDYWVGKTQEVLGRL